MASMRCGRPDAGGNQMDRSTVGDALSASHRLHQCSSHKTHFGFSGKANPSLTRVSKKSRSPARSKYWKAERPAVRKPLGLPIPVSYTHLRAHETLMNL
eukprot:3799657-Prymnesium_polylepis.1